MAGLKFRVLLDSETNSEVFRDILIDENNTFETFYQAIFRSFNFTGEQMASFYVSDNNWDKGHEISFMELSVEDMDEFGDIPDLMQNATLKDYIKAPDQKFILVYDFMRMWIFLIELIAQEKDAPANPEVVLAVGMAPPEDSRAAEDVEMETFGDDEDFEDEMDLDEFEDGYEDDFSSYDY